MKNIHTYLAQLTKIVPLFFLMLSIPIQSYGRDVSFSWTANSESSLIGYKLYYKEGSSSAPPYDGKGLIEGDGPILIDGDATTYMVTGLSTEKTYHFVLTAYGDDDVESDYSAIATVYPNPSPVYSNPSPTIIKISTQ